MIVRMVHRVCGGGGRRRPVIRLVVAGRLLRRPTVFTLGTLGRRLFVFVFGAQVGAGELGFTVLEQALEHGGSVGDLLGREDTVMASRASKRTPEGGP